MRADAVISARWVILPLLFIVVGIGVGAETWQFSADQVSSTQAGDNPRTILDGNARVESDKLIISASHLVLGGKDYKSISGEKGVSLVDTERGISVSSERFEYDRVAKILSFREQVSLIDEDKDIVIRCESLNLQEENDLVIMQVSVRLIKGDTVSRGEFATYWMNDNILEISGRPVVWRKDDEYRADRIRVNLDTDEITMEGAVAGALTTEKNE